MCVYLHGPNYLQNCKKRIASSLCFVFIQCTLFLDAPCFILSALFLALHWTKHLSLTTPVLNKAKEWLLSAQQFKVYSHCLLQVFLNTVDNKSLFFIDIKDNLNDYLFSCHCVAVMHICYVQYRCLSLQQSLALSWKQTAEWKGDKERWYDNVLYCCSFSRFLENECPCLTHLKDNNNRTVVSQKVKTD